MILDGGQIPLTITQYLLREETTNPDFVNYSRKSSSQLNEGGDGSGDDDEVVTLVTGSAMR
jgi:hypothetical protein